MTEEIRQIASRIRELREISGCAVSELSGELGVDKETYESYESGQTDIPISALYHISQKFGVDLTEILTGSTPRLDTYCLVRRGKGADVERFPGYNFKSLASKFKNKIMEPLLVTIEPGEEPELITHPGQEFNIVLEGQVELVFGGKKLVLSEGDSVYFNPIYPHGQRALGGKKAIFLTVIAE